MERSEFSVWAWDGAGAWGVRVYGTGFYEKDGVKEYGWDGSHGVRVGVETEYLAFKLILRGFVWFVATLGMG